MRDGPEAGWPPLKVKLPALADWKAQVKCQAGCPVGTDSGRYVQLIAEGRTTKEVAQILGMSVKTAEFHRSRLMEKLDIHETASLVRYAIRKGIVQA